MRGLLHEAVLGEAGASVRVVACAHAVAEPRVIGQAEVFEDVGAHVVVAVDRHVRGLDHVAVRRALEHAVVERPRPSGVRVLVYLHAEHLLDGSHVLLDHRKARDRPVVDRHDLYTLVLKRHPGGQRVLAQRAGKHHGASFRLEPLANLGASRLALDYRRHLRSSPLSRWVRPFRSTSA